MGNASLYEQDDEVRDKKVSYMLEKIQSGYGFAKYEWPGGVMSLDLIDIVKVKKSVPPPPIPLRRLVPTRRRR